MGLRLDLGARGQCSLCHSGKACAKKVIQQECLVKSVRTMR